MNLDWEQQPIEADEYHHKLVAAATDLLATIPVESDDVHAQDVRDATALLYIRKHIELARLGLPNDRFVRHFLDEITLRAKWWKPR